MSMQNPNSDLTSAVQKLRAAQSEEEIHLTLKTLRAALRYADDHQRFALLDNTLEPLRAEVLQLAQDACNNNPAEFPSRTQSLLRELPALHEKCPHSAPPHMEAQSISTEIPQLCQLSEDQSPESIHTLVSALTGYFDKHPDSHELGYRRLTREAENTILGDFMPASLSIPDFSPEAHRKISLLAALDGAPDPAYAFDFLGFYDGFFTTLGTDDLCEENNYSRLGRKLTDVRAALLNAGPVFTEGYLAHLKSDIQNCLLNWLHAEPAAYDLPEHVHTCIGLLRKVVGCELLDTASENDRALGTTVGALNSTNRLGVLQDPEYLVNDWMELSGLTDSLHFCSILISDQAAFTLTLQILSGVLAYSIAIPSTLERLLRFYLAISLSTNRALTDSDVLAWILNRDAVPEED